MIEQAEPAPLTSLAERSGVQEKKDNSFFGVSNWGFKYSAWFMN